MFWVWGVLGFWVCLTYDGGGLICLDVFFSYGQEIYQKELGTAIAIMRGPEPAKGT